MKNLNNRGSAILTVLGIVGIVSIVCGSLGFMANQQIRMARVTRETLKARLIAESGLNVAYNKIKKNFSLAASFNETGQFDDGTYQVRSMALGSADNNRALLVSEGVCGLGRYKVSADLENRPRIVSDDGAGIRTFDLLYDLLVGGKLDAKGNFDADVTDVHANGNVDLSGSANIDAMTVSSAGTVTWKKADGSVTILNNQSPVEILSEALQTAITAFIEHAVRNGAVYDNGADIPSSPPGGVAYCTGSASGWSGKGAGCFIFAGNIALQGVHLDLNSVNGYPALIVLGTDQIKINNTAKIKGIVIIPNGSLHINGTADIYGAIVIGQSMTGNGTANLYAGDGQSFNLPFEELTEDNVVITAWH
jgi:hypothetical protein